MAQSQEDKVRQEIAIMKKCHHPNVVRLIEVLDDSSKKIYMVLEYLEKGEIHWQDNDANPILTLDEARDTARDVVSGLEYLHFQGIVHRDIKPANLLRDKTGTVKISDFGVSYASNVDGETNDELELAKTAGTPAFFAPELCTTTAPNGGPRPPITNKIDIWAFGVTLFCLVFGKLPFSAENEYELFDVISRERLVFPDEVPVFPVPRGKKSHHSMFYNVNDDLVEESLDHHVKKKSPPTKNEETAPAPLVPLDPKLDSVKDLLRKLLERDPTKRIDIEGIKHHPWMMQGMDNASLQNFLTATADDQRIIVTNEEVQTAVLGLGTRIKRRLSRLGSSALQFAGFRRKNSSSSTSSAAQSSSTSRSQSRDDSTGPLTYSDTTGLTSKPSSRSPRKVSQSETARKNKKYFDQAVFSSYSGHDSDFSNASSSRVPSSQSHTHNNTSQGAYDCSPLIDRATSINKSANSSYSSLSSISSYQSSNPQTLWHPNTRDRTASALARNLAQNRDTAVSGGICTSSVLMTNAASQVSYPSSHSASGAGIFPLSGRHISYSGPSSAPQHFIVEGQQRFSNDSCNCPVNPMAESSNNSLFLNDMGSSVTGASTGSDYCTPPSRPRLHSDTPSFSAFRGGMESVCPLSTTSPHSSGSGYESGDGNFSNPENKRDSGASLEDAVGSFPGDGLGRSTYLFGLSTSANSYNLHGIVAGHSAHGIIDEDDEIDPKDTARKVLPSNVSTNSTIESSHRPSSQKSDSKQSPSKALPHPPSLTGLATACPSPSVFPLLGVEPIADASAYNLNSVGPGVAAERCDSDSATLETKPGPNACGSWRDGSKASGIVNPRSRPSPNQLQTAVSSDICSYGANQNGNTCDLPLNACSNKNQFGEARVPQKRSVSTTSPLCRGKAGLNSCVPKERSASYGPTQSELEVFSRFIVNDNDDDDDDSSDQEGGFTLTVGPKPGMISQFTSPGLAGQSEKRASISVAVASRLASPENSNEHPKPRVNSVPLVVADNTTNEIQSSLRGDKAAGSAGAADLESVPLPDLLAQEMEALATKETSLKSSVYDARLATKQPEPAISKPGPASRASVPSQYAYLAQRGPSNNKPQSTGFVKPTGITKQSLGYGSKMQVTDDDSSDDSSEDEGFFIRPRPTIKYA